MIRLMKVASVLLCSVTWVAQTADAGRLILGLPSKYHFHGGSLFGLSSFFGENDTIVVLYCSQIFLMILVCAKYNRGDE